MTNKALFAGLVVDEFDQVLETTYVGQDSCYIIDDQGFKQHILSETIDRQVLNEMVKMVEGNEEILSEQAAKMLGQDDLFTHAILLNQLKQMDKQFEQLLLTGMPEEARAYLGMMGFKIIVDMHGEVLDVKQPGILGPEGDE